MLVAHNKIFIDVCASGALSGPCLEKKRMVGDAFCPCRNCLVSESGCEHATVGSRDRLKNIYSQIQLCCSFILAAYCGYVPWSGKALSERDVRSTVSSHIH